MLIKIKPKELILCKSSFEVSDHLVETVTYLDLNLEESATTFIVSGSNAALYELLYKLAFTYDLELL